MVPQFLENLTDEELKKEAKNEAKNDALSMIIKSLKNLASRVPGQEETVKNLEIFRLKMILRWVGLFVFIIKKKNIRKMFHFSALTLHFFLQVIANFLF